MASVYILYSKKLNSFYIGSCKDLSYRVDQHLNKEFKGSFTAKAEDWEIYLSIDDLLYDQARLIEAHLKKMKNRTYIQNLAKYPEIIQRLKDKYQ
jgi:putative endonuclease